MKLLGKRVIFEQLEEAGEKKSDIIITDEEPKPYVFGKIIAVGDECGFKVGKKILVNRHAANPVVWEGKELKIIEPGLIIAIDE